MDRQSWTLLAKDYDYLSPLATGDVVPEAMDLKFIRSTADALERTLRDPDVHAGELSFSRHLIRLSEGDRSFIGLPFFVVRAFRHRCFFVKKGSRLQSLKDLARKRVGTTEWPATGNTWSRAALHEQGVQTSAIQWFVGPIDGPPTSRPQGSLPPYARLVAPGQTLRGMLLNGEVDAIMVPDPPAGFYDTDGAIVRLLSDYPQAEREYFRRTGIYPAHHIIGIRRVVFDRAPWVARSLYRALEESKTRWLSKIREITEMTPWLLTDMEMAQALIGADWNPSGVAQNRKMIQTLCDELLAQNLVNKPLDGATVFNEFENVM